MSTLYKAPTINTVIEEITAAKTSTIDYIQILLKILNGETISQTIFRTVSYDTTGTYAQKLPATMALKMCEAFIYFNNPNPARGVLFKRASGKDSAYWYIELGQPLCHIYKLSVDSVVAMPDCLTVFEIRETIKQHGGTGGESEWERAIKPYLVYAPAGEGTVAKIECGTNLEVDGKIYLNESFDFYNSYGDHLTLVPKPENADLNKILHVGTMGPTWVNPSGGGTKIYLHKITKGNDFVSFYTTKSTVIEDESTISCGTLDGIIIGYGNHPGYGTIVVDSIGKPVMLGQWVINSLTGYNSFYMDIEGSTYTITEI